ncbi:SusD/RagB family nutrient-binding outer membrane lipoprotein [Galbibacter orientalis]|uniref:SusD/RagB family nutrient-binding outer membrane lipoprotein n=1 Tax=Galbibacter orientalis TaxID=453852 RepID=UPI0030012982
MKNIYINTLLIALFITSCSNFDEDINTNPNVPSQASGMQLIAQAELSLPGLSSSPQGEFMSQYLAETQYVGTSLYPQQSTSFYGWYQGPLADLQAVITSDNLTGTEGPIENQIAVAKILKAYYFWNLTDRWGDIPYSEALKGQEDFTPIYDSQESIYKDLFAELKEASNMIVTGNLSNDIIYDGDISKWKKFSNTVRMLMALRLSEVDPATAQAEFVSAIDDGVFTSNDDNLFFQHLADANNQNYWYGQIVNQNREWWALTEGLVDQMKPVNDPRLPIYGNPARDSGEYVGMLYGDEVNLGTQEYSLLGDAIYAQDAPVYLVTYAQVLFAMAEASQRGWIAGDTASFYESAIESSILQWTGNTDTVADFMMEPGIAFNDAIGIEQIATQRWVHLFMFGYEAWAEWRRTGFPNMMVSPNGAAVPARLSYPDNEAFNNEVNYNEALDRQFGGEDSIYGQLWWDK